jgi:hypothetical protein
MGRVNASQSSPSDVHQQHGFGAAVGYIILIGRDHAEAWPDRCVPLVAMFTSFRGGDQLVILHRGLNGPRVTIEHHRHQLAGARHFGLQPAGGSGCDVAIGAGQGLMGRLSGVGGELGLHNVAGLAAKLIGIHVLNGAIAELAGDDYVRHGHDAEEDSRTAPGGSPIFDFVQIARELVLGECDADRDKNQSGEENDGNRNEDQEPNVGIVHATAAEVERQHEQP